MKARPSFSFYPINATDVGCKQYIFRVDFACESGYQFAAFMPIEADLDGYVELDQMEEMFIGIGKTATSLHKIFELAKKKQVFNGIDAPLPPEDIAAKADA